MRIGIIDYGAGNLQSVRNALHALGHDPAWIKAPSDLETLDVVIFPGQGEFRGCVESLRERELFEPLRAWIENGRPYFGICLGYQALFESSEEAPLFPGLSVFKGTVKRFTQNSLSGESSSPPTRNQTATGREAVRDQPKRSEGTQQSVRASSEQDKSGIFKIPHMGWNEIKPADPADPLWEGLPEAPHAYFVHSYYPAPADPAVVAATTTYGAIEFASAIRSGQIVATQFHPEKSQSVGLRILGNFLAQLVPA